MKNGKGPTADASPLLRRTREGSHELVAKRLPLTDDQRKILLYANGRRTVDEINTFVPATRANPDLLLDLEAMGLVEMVVVDDSLPVPRGESLAAAPAATPGPSSQGEVEALKRELVSELARLLGSESGPVVTKVQTLGSRAEIKAIFPKLVDLIRLYAGGAASERFAGEYAKQL